MSSERVLIQTEHLTIEGRSRAGHETWFRVRELGVALDIGRCPDEIIAVPDIPYTISGKKTETPVKKVLMGKDPKKVVNEGSLRNPSSMDFYINMANQTGKKR